MANLLWGIIVLLVVLWLVGLLVHVGGQLIWFLLVLALVVLVVNLLTGRSRAI